MGKIYNFLKSLIPWQIKARIKGILWDILFYRTAQIRCTFTKKKGISLKKRSSKQQINILYLVPHLVFGGAETMLLSLVEKIDHSQFNLNIACSQKLGELSKKFKPYVNRIYDLSKIHTSFWHQGKYILELIKEMEIDIVHISNNEIFYFICPFIKLKAGAVIINWVHCDPKYFERLHNLGYKRFKKFIDMTVVVADSTRNFLTQNKGLAKNKVITIRDGVDINLFNPKLFEGKTKLIKNKYKIPENHQTISFISRLTSEKEPLKFIKIAKALNKDNPNTTFIVAGDGYYKKYMIVLAKKLKIIDKIKFLGFIKEIPELLSITTILVSTSSSEGFGLNVAEAMAMKIPVVAPNVGGLKELVINNKNGFIIDNPTIENFCNKINILLKNPDYRMELGENGRQYIKDNFNIEKSIAEMTSLYKKVIHI